MGRVIPFHDASQFDIYKLVLTKGEESGKESGFLLLVGESITGKKNCVYEHLKGMDCEVTCKCG